MSPLLDGFPRTSDAPAMAPADHATRAPIEGPIADDRGTLYVGSGVPVAQHPELPFDASAVCGACGGRDTVCVAARVEADLVEKDVEYELHCRGCGRYTRYAYWR